MFSFLKKYFYNSTEDTADENLSTPSMDELRLYSRYSLIFPQVGRLKIYDNNQVGTILNLSYGGLLVNFEDPWNQEIGPQFSLNYSDFAIL